MKRHLVRLHFLFCAAADTMIHICSKARGEHNALIHSDNPSCPPPHPGPVITFQLSSRQEHWLLFHLRTRRKPSSLNALQCRALEALRHFGNEPLPPKTWIFFFFSPFHPCNKQEEDAWFRVKNREKPEASWVREATKNPNLISRCFHNLPLA